MSQDEGRISESLERLKINQGVALPRRKSVGVRDAGRRKSTIADLTNLSDSDSDEDEEFFDAVDAGEVEVVDEMPTSVSSPPPPAVGKNDREPIEDLREQKKSEIQSSFKGYEDPIRKRFKMDADNRPKISLWVYMLSSIS